MTTTQPEKRKARFDFSSLHDPASMQSARKWATEAGQRVVHELPLDQVIEDPDQPRRKFNPVALQELAETIRARGVMQPILVREKGEDGKHMIIQGARRYRASGIAERTTISAIVIPAAEMDRYDCYSQVIENAQRENLDAEEMCNFIVGRISAGDKKGEIAKRLGMDAKAVTVHLALHDAAPNVQALFRAGKISGVYPLYDLTRLQEKAPDAAAALIAEAEQNPFGEITQAAVRRALKEAEAGTGAAAAPASGATPLSQPSPAANGTGMRGGEDPQSGTEAVAGEPGQSDATTAFVVDHQPGAADPDPDDGHGAQEPKGGSEPQAPAEPKNVVQLPFHNPARDTDARGDGRKADPNHIKKPLLLGHIDGEPVKLLLTRRPTTEGLVHVSWEHTGIEEEVALDRITLTLLSDMKVQETA